MNPGDRAIISAIITLGHNLEMKVVAEAVETEAQLDFLRSLHCDQIQGFLFSRPIPPEEFARLLSLPRPFLRSLRS